MVFRIVPRPEFPGRFKLKEQVTVTVTKCDGTDEMINSLSQLSRKQTNKSKWWHGIPVTPS